MEGSEKYLFDTGKNPKNDKKTLKITANLFWIITGGFRFPDSFLLNGANSKEARDARN